MFSLINHVNMHSFRSVIEATEKLKQLSGNFPGGWAFEQLFGPLRRGGGGGVVDLNKIFQKFTCHGGYPGWMFKLRFDW